MNTERAMDPSMIRRIDAVLERVKEPETFRSVGELNLVERVTYSDSERRLLVSTIIATGVSTCMVCGVVTEHLRQAIQRDLLTEFRKEFPDLDVEVV